MHAHACMRTSTETHFLKAVRRTMLGQENERSIESTIEEQYIFARVEHEILRCVSYNHASVKMMWAPPPRPNFGKNYKLQVSCEEKLNLEILGEV